MKQFIMGSIVFSPDRNVQLMDLGKRDIYFDTVSQKHVFRLDRDSVKDCLISCVEHLLADGVTQAAITTYVETAIGRAKEKEDDRDSGPTDRG